MQDGSIITGKKAWSTDVMQVMLAAVARTSDTRMAARVLKQDPNAYTVTKNG